MGDAFNVFVFLEISSISTYTIIAMGAGMSINFVVVAPLARKAGLTEIEVAGILTLSAALFRRSGVGSLIFLAIPNHDIILITTQLLSNCHQASP